MQKLPEMALIWVQGKWTLLCKCRFCAFFFFFKCDFLFVCLKKHLGQAANLSLVTCFTKSRLHHCRQACTLQRVKEIHFPCETSLCNWTTTEWSQDATPETSRLRACKRRSGLVLKGRLSLHCCLIGEHSCNKQI